MRDDAKTAGWHAPCPKCGKRLADEQWYALNRGEETECACGQRFCPETEQERAERLERVIREDDARRERERAEYEERTRGLPRCPVHPRTALETEAERERGHCGYCAGLITEQYETAYAREQARRRLAEREALAALPSLELVSIRDALTMPDPEWIIPGWLHARCIAAITGAKYTGKSTIMYRLAGSIATGQGFLGLTVAKSGPVVIVLGEGEAGLPLYARALLADLGGELPDISFILARFGLTEATAARLAEVISKAYPAGIAALFFDAKADYYQGAENSNDDQEMQVKAVKALRDGLECAVIATSHTGHGKDAKDRGRGGSRWEDALEAAWIVTPGELRVVKVKYAEPPAPLMFGIREVEGTGGAMPYALTGLEAALRAKREADAAAEAARQEAEDAMSDALTEIKDGTVHRCVLAMLRKAGKCNSETALAFLDVQVRTGHVTRTGTGKRGDPYIYAAIRELFSVPSVPSVRNGNQECRSDVSRNYRERKVRNAFDLRKHRKTESRLGTETTG